MKKVIIMRGSSGSGKSFLAENRQMDAVLAGETSRIVSADYFFNKLGDGNYLFIPSRLGEAHLECQTNFIKFLKLDINLIIVDNTNTRPKEARFYAQKAKEYGYEIEILEPDTEWKYNVDELEKRTQHRVPREVLQGMVDRIKENQYTVKDLLN